MAGAIAYPVAVGEEALRTKVLVSRPLSPIADRMRDLASTARDFWIASAFLGTTAVDQIVGAALQGGATVRLLTGTFGNNTRKSTFARLFTLQKRGRLEARIWDTGWHRRFHGKLYLWHLRRGGHVAWLGSANLTEGGLNEEGELVLELRDSTSSRAIAQLRRAFLKEWSRGTPLDQRFLARYEEAARPAPDIRTVARQPRRTGSGRSATAPPRGSNFIANAYGEFGERRANQLARLLSPPARELDFFATPTKALSQAKAGDRGLFVDHISRQAALVEVVDAARDGRRRVVAYVPLFARRAWLPWNAALARRAGRAISAISQGRTLRDRRLDADQFSLLAAALYPGRPLP